MALIAGEISETIAQTRQKDSQARNSSVTVAAFLGIVAVVVSVLFLQDENYIGFGLAGLFGLTCLRILSVPAMFTGRELERIAREVLRSLGQQGQS